MQHLPDVPLVECAPLPNIAADATCVVIETISGTILVGCRAYSTSFIPYIKHDVDFVVSLDNEVSCDILSSSILTAICVVYVV